jgi:hypothetical protein
MRKVRKPRPEAEGDNQTGNEEAARACPETKIIPVIALKPLAGLWCRLKPGVKYLQLRKEMSRFD